MKNYDGTDFSGSWRVVSYEGKTLTRKEESGRVTLLVGFTNFRKVAQAAKEAGGVPVRE